ncbi:type I restriction-modification enzyme R subunit C-terminal domain-containing protein [Sulfuricella sp. T08]|uniref:type I restriction-modification enzyme R subunit C-terminal domain-containing protein n=1 Tax=Sulfuricella sp. T08 TaxID=1632857 RepID=UPI0009E5DFD0|nr:type I restriction-modification enzyme R subunit C-terminal domain-containing protein [Sulfuricella sp. T08]
MPAIRLNTNFKTWLVGAAPRREKPFTQEQIRWLEMIRDHIAANLGIEPDDFEYAPFAQEGGLGKVHQLFGDELNNLIEQLNETLAA